MDTLGEELNWRSPDDLHWRTNCSYVVVGMKLARSSCTEINIDRITVSSVAPMSSNIGLEGITEG